MITENIPSYVRLFSKCWDKGLIPDCSSLDEEDTFMIRTTLFERIGFRDFCVGDRLLNKLFSNLLGSLSLDNMELAVIALDSIYHTRLDSPILTAHALYNLNSRIDLIPLITQTTDRDRRKVIDVIATVIKREDSAAKYLYSFATKFCNFVSPEKYPIYDKYSATMLYRYLQNKQLRVCGDRVVYSRFGDYSYYIAAYEQFIEAYDLQDFSYKEIDIFLWTSGKLIEESEYFDNKEVSFYSIEFIPIDAKRKIRVLIDGHLFSQEKLCDRFLSDKYLGQGINPIFSVKPLKSHIGKYMTIEFDNSTTIGNVQEMIFKQIWGPHWEYIGGPSHLFFYADDLRMEIDNALSCFATLVDKYFDKDRTGRIRVAIYLSEDAGSVYSEKNLRFSFHSKELTRHNTPHIHVEDTNHDREVSISLLDGSVLDGGILSKDLKRARQIISEHQKGFLEYWCAKTDGLSVDVNHVLGLIDY